MSNGGCGLVYGGIVLMVIGGFRLMAFDRYGMGYLIGGVVVMESGFFINRHLFSN